MKPLKALVPDSNGSPERHAAGVPAAGFACPFDLRRPALLPLLAFGQLVASLLRSSSALGLRSRNGPVLPSTSPWIATLHIVQMACGRTI